MLLEQVITDSTFKIKADAQDQAKSDLFDICGEELSCDKECGLYSILVSLGFDVRLRSGFFEIVSFDGIANKVTSDALACICEFSQGEIYWQREDGAQWMVNYDGAYPKHFYPEITWVEQ